MDDRNRLGGNMSMLFAATYPERTIALATFGCTAKRVWSPDYPWAPTPEQRQETVDHVERQWTTGIDWEDIAPSLAPPSSADLVRGASGPRITRGLRRGSSGRRRSITSSGNERPESTGRTSLPASTHPGSPSSRVTTRAVRAPAPHPP